MSTDPLAYATACAERERAAVARYVTACRVLADTNAGLYEHEAKIVSDLLAAYEGRPYDLCDHSIPHAQLLHRQELARNEQRHAATALDDAISDRIAAFAALPWPKP